VIGPQTFAIDASSEAITGIVWASMDEACRKRQVLLLIIMAVVTLKEWSLCRFARKINAEFAVAIDSFDRSLPTIEVVKVRPFDLVFPFSPAGCCSSLNQATA